MHRCSILPVLGPVPGASAAGAGVIASKGRGKGKGKGKGTSTMGKGEGEDNGQLVQVEAIGLQVPRFSVVIINWTLPLAVDVPAPAPGATT